MAAMRNLNKSLGAAFPPRVASGTTSRNPWRKKAAWGCFEMFFFFLWRCSFSFCSLKWSNCHLELGIFLWLHPTMCVRLVLCSLLGWNCVYVSVSKYTCYMPKLIMFTEHIMPHIQVFCLCMVMSSTIKVSKWKQRNEKRSRWYIFLRQMKKEYTVENLKHWWF